MVMGPGFKGSVRLCPQYDVEAANSNTAYKVCALEHCIYFYTLP